MRQLIIGKAFFVLILFGLMLGITWAADDTPVQRSPLVIQLQIKDQAINQVTARYIKRGIRQAEEEQAECVILMLDTPGGLVNSTRDIVKAILASHVPVVVYVAPSGSRAASAGMFITISGHVAAMAPGTNIGAAHPAQIGGLPGRSVLKKSDDKEQPSVMEEKILNDTVAWARSLAKLRERNEEWVVEAVKNSQSAPASEAVEANAVDLMAESIEELLNDIDGKKVMIPQGEQTLQTRQSVIQKVEMWWGERFLAILSNPNLAFLLLVIGFYGVLFELLNPGWGIPGTIGVICLLLAFLALSVLPINYVGLALMGIGLGFFVAEVFLTSYGFLGLGGTLCLVLGGTMLINSPAGFQDLSWSVLIPVAVAAGLITVFVLTYIAKAHREKVQTGGSALKGQKAIAANDFSLKNGTYSGTVQIHGEWWKAISPEPVAAGHTLEVQDQEGLTLYVQPLNPPS